MNFPMSNRLLACCTFVRKGDRVADVGCDHGYLGIYLLQNEIARSVLAADINQMPLETACRNSEKYGVREKMTFYRSDGLKTVPRDFDTLVCAGMGADTMISILEQAPWLRCGDYRLILQCQSRLWELRRWLSASGFRIVRETLARDGKFIYPVMEIIYQPGEVLPPGQCWLSPALLESDTPLLPDYVERVLSSLRQTVAGLGQSGQNPDKLAAYQAALSELEAIRK